MPFLKYRVGEEAVLEARDVIGNHSTPTGSWALFSLAHHFLVWMAAELAEPGRRPFFSQVNQSWKGLADVGLMTFLD